jgi:hypothetical protein
MMTILPHAITSSFRHDACEAKAKTGLCPTRSLEMWLAVFTSMFGVWWALFGNHAPAYPSCSGLLALMPASMWAMIGITTGLLHMSAILFGPPAGRKVAALLSSGVRIYITILMVRSTPYDPAMISHLCVSGASLWSYWRIRP